MKNLIMPILLIIILIIISSCDPHVLGPLNYEDSGVMIKYSRYRGGEGSINNKNDFPIIVRSVWQFRGETTQWVKELRPNESITIIKSDPQDAFYIYNKKTGRLIGFIKHTGP